MNAAGGRSTWPAHYAAAEAMGLDPQTAYETYDGGFAALAAVCRERREELSAWLDEREREG